MKYLDDYYKLKAELNKKRAEDVKIQNELEEKINNAYNSSLNIFSNVSTNPKYPTIYNSEVPNYYASWVSACVDVRAYSVASAKLVMWEKINQSDSHELDSHSFIELLENPNTIMSKHELYEMTIQSLDLYGNAYWHIRKGQKLKKPYDIWIIPPYEMEVLINEYGIPVGYKRNNYSYNQNINKQTEFALDDIIHFKYPNPANPYYGMSIIQKAAYSIGIDLYQNQYQYNLLRNDANIKGYVEADMNISPEDAERQEKLFTKKYAGSANSGKTMIGKKFIPTQLVPKELDYLKSKGATKEEILAQFQVPSSMLGAVERITYANSDATIAGFLTNTIQPLCARLDSKLNQYIKKIYGKQYFIKSDLNIPQDPIIIFREHSLGLQSGSISRNEFRIETGRDPYTADPSFDIPTPVSNITNIVPDPDNSKNTGANATNDNTTADNTDVNVPVTE